MRQMSRKEPLLRHFHSNERAGRGEYVDLKPRACRDLSQTFLVFMLLTLLVWAVKTA